MLDRGETGGWRWVESPYWNSPSEERQGGDVGWNPPTGIPQLRGGPTWDCSGCLDLHSAKFPPGNHKCSYDVATRPIKANLIQLTECSDEIEWVSEWLSDGWVSDWLSIWVSEWWVSECLSEWVMSEWGTEKVNGWVDEWVSVWVSEWVSEWWVSEGLKKLMDEWMSEWVCNWWVSERVSIWVSELVDEWMSERVRKWESERVSDWVSGWVSEYMSEWVSGWADGKAMN